MFSSDFFEYKILGFWERNSNRELLLQHVRSNFSDVVEYSETFLYYTRNRQKLVTSGEKVLNLNAIYLSQRHQVRAHGQFHLQSH